MEYRRLQKPRIGPCISIHSDGQELTILILCEDDVLLLVKNVMVLRRTKQQLMGHFLIRDVGDMSFVLRTGVNRKCKKGNSGHQSRKL